MAATLDCVDLLCTDVEPPRLRPRFAGPAAPPPRAIERLPRAMPATIDLEAPVWPGAGRTAEADDVALPAPEAAPVAEATLPIVEAPLVLVDEPPVRIPEPIRVAEEPPVRVVEPPVRVEATLLHLEPPPVRVPPPVSRAFFEPEFEDMEAQWFEEDAFLAERPAGLPWWALAIPASAALGMLSMVVTALVLLVAWT